VSGTGVVGLPDGVACLALLAMERLALPHPGGVDEPLMTADQVVALLPVLRSSVYDYARRTDVPLPSVRIGWHRRFLRSEVMAWLRALPRT